eukprot:3843967-Amphidinium_carterae.1
MTFWLKACHPTRSHLTCTKFSPIFLARTEELTLRFSHRTRLCKFGRLGARYGKLEKLYPSGPQLETYYIHLWTHYYSHYAKQPNFGLDATNCLKTRALAHQRTKSTRRKSLLELFMIKTLPKNF